MYIPDIRSGGHIMKQSPLHTFTRLHRSLLPTPFHKLENLSRETGVEIYCKRDDLTGFGFGGNKTRKLDYLMAEARSLGATDIVATGAVQSNFCRISAAYAAADRLPCFLILGGKKESEQAGGNLLLDELFGAEIHRVYSDKWDDWEKEAQNLAGDLRKNNRKPYYMPIGGSTSVGAMGYAHGFLEFLKDNKNAACTHLVHATSSGGTQAGLLAGKILSGWDGSITGIAVAKSRDQLSREIHSLLNEMSPLLGFTVPPDIIHVDDRWIGESYGSATASGNEAKSLFARLEGIVLDDVYSAKAAAGLMGQIRSGEISPGSRIAFLHTGGSPELFSYLLE